MKRATRPPSIADAQLGRGRDDGTQDARSDAVLILGRRPLAIVAACRVVYTVATDHQRGFAYGTLPGHPEAGEESFIVTNHDDDRVTLTVRAFSRPATRLARAGGPLTRLAQDLATHRYLRSLLVLANAKTTKRGLETDNR